VNEQGDMTNGTIAKGLAGSATALGAGMVSCLPAIETGLRIASLGVGLAVGLVTLYGLVKKLNKR